MKVWRAERINLTQAVWENTHSHTYKRNCINERKLTVCILDQQTSTRMINVSPFNMSHIKRTEFTFSFIHYVGETSIFQVSKCFLCIRDRTAIVSCQVPSALSSKTKFFAHTTIRSTRSTSRLFLFNIFSSFCSSSVFHCWLARVL